MRTRTRDSDAYRRVITYDNQRMTEQAASPLRHVIEAPFTRRAWSELGHSLASFPVAVSAMVFIVPMLHDGFLWAVSASLVRRWGAAARFLARELLGEDIPVPPPFKPALRLKVATPDAAGALALTDAVAAAGGKARAWETKPGVTTKRLPGTLGLGGTFGIANLAGSFTFLPLGATLLLVGPWATHGLTEMDRRLMRGLLGPGSPADRIRALEESRARAVDDSAARPSTCHASPSSSATPTAAR
jgi:hypothetical protein